MKSTRTRLPPARSWAHTGFALVVAAIVAVLLPRSALAERIAPDDIPPELQPWTAWVLSDVGSEACTPVGDTRICDWPGALALDLDGDGGTFELQVFVEQPTFVALPGGGTVWPEDVEVDGDRGVVLARGDVPHVQLGRGSHAVRGRFSWKGLPETLGVGHATAFVHLEIDGAPVPLVKREGSQLWLEGLETSLDAANAPERIELSVFRHISDGVPMRVETRMVWQVAGRARELTVPSPLVPGTVPLAVEGDLAVALEPTGALRVQLTPGRHELRLTARTRGMPKKLENPPRPGPWPAEEVWVFEPSSELRVVQIAGVPGIDASRTELPDEWKDLGAYAVAAGAAMAFETQRRGEPEPPPNRITLHRELWLDESADAFTVRDSLGGEMHQGWRLDLRKGDLGRVTVHGVDQVITTAPSGEGRGVELRDASLSMQAVSRLPRTSSLGAVGWSEDVESLSIHLQLPPGWDVLSATGVDEMQGTWVSRWDLFSVFYLMVLTMAVVRLIGWRAAAVAGAAIILSHGHEGAPRYIWAVLVILAALVRVVRSPRFAPLLRGGFYGVFAVLIVVFLQFSVERVRYALYPHLDMPAMGAVGGLAPSMQPAPAAPPDTDARAGEVLDAPSVEQQAEKAEGAGVAAVRRYALVKESAAPRSALARGGVENEQKPDAVVQTGPGIPEGLGRLWTLGWSGPVVASHEMRLVLISPGVMRVLTALELVALGALAWLLLRTVRRTPWPSPDSRMRGAGGASARKGAATATAAVLLFAAPPAHGSDPSDERLAELRARLTKPPDCAPDCVTVASARLALADSMTFTAEVHAGGPSAYVLPGPASVLTDVGLEVDGKPGHEVRLSDAGAYVLRVDAGVHEVRLSARLVGNRTTLDVGTRPRRVEVDARGWTVTGVSDAGQVEGGTLTLVRDVLSPPGEGARKNDARVSVSVPPWFVVTRQVGLGVTGRMHTVIRRVSDPAHPELLELPLLPGEQVTTPGVEVRKGQATISFPREVEERAFESTLALPKNDAALSLTLSAPKDSSRSEVWVIDCGVVWRCRTRGLDPVSHLSDGRFLETYRPYPGERLNLEASQPVAAPGQSLTIESATLTLTPGVRLGRGELELRLRTSRSQVHAMRIPQSAKLERLTVDGEAQAAKNEGGTVRVALLPGSHTVRVAWQRDAGLTASFVSPEVDAGAPGVSFRTVVDLPPERWLLFTNGPSQGPAILFWAYLLLIVAVAAVLGRIRMSPLSSLEWSLLGLGLTQVPVEVAVGVAAWFFLVATRPRWPGHWRRLKNLGQLGLIAATLLFLLALTGSVYEGLVSSPDMEVHGAGSHGSHLVWYRDRSAGPLPNVGVFSVSIWIWRAVMLAWSLWLARALVRWLRWAWECANVGGFWVSRKSSPPSGGDHTEAEPADDEADPGGTRRK